ncbi:uncharacterized protein BDR25DRAFT_393136 [Lindgomyces ingoldianus]|uniref:Uncharacterized protein n=1 Tax=Lindgomyces ingoldianus TaxID=673940 RepID=A0ACB6QZE3_9PLEO|nr:uncharacterized protein BDR25DRAFT_393136 [Lindgomyces ingoldianus]KAF2472271.1 hypothetical protein BDR25DRAFT_393136 [Lindgomyces ingoldianus]
MTSLAPLSTCRWATYHLSSEKGGFVGFNDVYERAWLNACHTYVPPGYPFDNCGEFSTRMATTDYPLGMSRCNRLPTSADFIKHTESSVAKSGQPSISRKIGRFYDELEVRGFRAATKKQVARKMTSMANAAFALLDAGSENPTRSKIQRPGDRQAFSSSTSQTRNGMQSRSFQDSISLRQRTSSLQHSLLESLPSTIAVAPLTSLTPSSLSGDAGMGCRKCTDQFPLDSILSPHATTPARLLFPLTPIAVFLARHIPSKVVVDKVKLGKDGRVYRSKNKRIRVNFNFAVNGKAEKTIEAVSASDVVKRDAIMSEKKHAHMYQVLPPAGNMDCSSYRSPDRLSQSRPSSCFLDSQYHTLFSQHPPSLIINPISSHPKLIHLETRKNGEKATPNLTNLSLEFSPVRSRLTLAYIHKQEVSKQAQIEAHLN